MLPFENSPDLLFYSYPTVPRTTIFHIRPYKDSDKADVYRVCLQTCNDGSDGTNDYLDSPDLLPDKLVGPFISYSADNCFVVVDDDDTVCGYVLTAPDVGSFFSSINNNWIPVMAKKYPAIDKTDNLTLAEEVVSSFHVDPSTNTTAHPADWCQSYVHISFLGRCHDSILGDPSVVKRAFTCAVTSLKIHASKGVYTRLRTCHRDTIQMYRSLGFLDLTVSDNSPPLSDDWLLLGRVI
jgi:protein O-GlcNAcase/histone acetyltransferase